MMSHSHIAAIYDGGATSEGRPYVVMEYVAGVPLTEYVDGHQLDLGARLDLFLQVCSAVSHAHQKEIIHRDLKPSNILITEVDGKAVPKVIDFGIAKMTQQPLTERTMETSLGEVIGTPEYMSPEQAAGTGLDVDTRADIYSLGVILYELLSGVHPLPREALKNTGLMEVLRLIREDDPTRPSTRVSTLGTAQDKSLSRRLAGDLDWIILRALEKDRERRYDSVLDLAEDIQRHRRHEPVAAGPPNLAYRVKKFVRRNRLAVSFGMVMTVVMLASVVAVAWQWRSAVVQRSRAEIAGEHARQEAVRAERINAFLQDMLAAADPGVMGKDVMVREVLDQAAAALESDLEVDPVSRADAHHTLGVTYTSLSLLREGRAHLETALALRRDLEGRDDENMVVEFLALSDCLFKLGERGEARSMALQGLRMQRRLVHEPDPLISRLLGRLAEVELHLGFFDDAQRLAGAAVRQVEALGPAHERVLGEMLVILARVLAERGNTIEGEAVARRALEIHERLLGGNHPLTLESMDRLSELLMRQGFEKDDEIEVLRTTILERSRRILGDDHLDVARARNNLANFLATRQGRLAEAHRQQLEAMRIWRLNYEGGHDYIVICLINLGFLASEMGDLERAEGHYREAVTMGVQLDAKPSTMQARINLSRTLHHRGQTEEALALSQTATVYQEDRLNPESTALISIWTERACLYLHLLRLEEAESLLTRISELIERRATAGNDFMGGLWYRQHLLGRLRALQGRWPEAGTLLEESLAELRRRNAGFAIRRDTFREAEAICRETGHTELADAHAEALVELEESLKSARSEASSPAGSS